MKKNNKFDDDYEQEQGETTGYRHGKKRKTLNPRYEKNVDTKTAELKKYPTEIIEKNSKKKKRKIFKPYTFNKNHNPLVSYAIIAISVGIVFFLVAFGYNSFNDFDGNSTTGTRYVSYKQKKQEPINAKEFIVKYQEAENNEVKVDSNDVYKSGNVKQDFKVQLGNNNVYQNKKGSYLCILKSYNMKKNYNEDTEHNYLECGSFYLDENKSPNDFLKANTNNLDDLADVESSDIYYYISGFFYSKEFCEKVVRWLEQ